MKRKAKLSRKDEMLSEYDFSNGVRGKYAKRHAIGFDIGGTKIEGAVISSQGEVIRSVRLPTPPDYAGTQKVILEIVQRLQGSEKLLGIGFGIPGSIDPKTNLLRNAPNSPAINKTGFFKELEELLPLPMQCENDANCLALSETQFGAAKGFKNVVGIIMGTGVGSGVIINGELLRGSNGLASELGHTILDVHGRVCLCGNQGCVEAYLSGPSILARYREAGGQEPLANATAVFSAQDPIAKSVAQETRYLFSRFIAAIASMYDPEIIVLGGGLANEKTYYKCANKIAEFVFGSRQAPLIKPAQHGDASGKLGAAALFFCNSS